MPFIYIKSVDDGELGRGKRSAFGSATPNNSKRSATESGAKTNAPPLIYCQTLTIIKRSATEKWVEASAPQTSVAGAYSLYATASECCGSEAYARLSVADWGRKEYSY